MTEYLKHVRITNLMNNVIKYVANTNICFTQFYAGIASTHPWGLCILLEWGH